MVECTDEAFEIDKSVWLFTFERWSYRGGPTVLTLTCGGLGLWSQLAPESSSTETDTGNTDHCTHTQITDTGNTDH